LGTYDGRGLLPWIAAPTLVTTVLRGRHHSALRPWQPSRAPPRSRVALVEDAAHLAKVEQADAFTSLLRDHLTHAP
jgi:pimeloyl-ACP methyl ester carboxylesterase